VNDDTAMFTYKVTDMPSLAGAWPDVAESCCFADWRLAVVAWLGL